METNTQNSVRSVPKELIPLMCFPSVEVLFSREKILKRTKALMRVTALGNVFRQKVRIIFQDIEGSNQVETTVWEVEEDAVILKDNVRLPINCIHEIIFYFNG